MKKRLQFIHPLKNESGAAALMGIVMGLIIMGTIAFNFLAESRQKQSGAILTYTSTNAFMIAEAGIRFVEKCLTTTDATCATHFPDSQNNADWTTIDDTITDIPFGDGAFTITFATHASNDADNIFVVSTGTYKGAQRSIRRFIPRFGQCPFIDVSQPATSCTNGSGVGTANLNNSSITPPLPNPAPQVDCPTDGGGNVDLVPALPALPAECVGCPNAACPNFNAGNHLNGSNFLIPRANNYFCTMNINNATVVKTTVNDGINNDDEILVAKVFRVQDTATVKLNDDAATIVSSTFTVTPGTDRVNWVGNTLANGDIVVLTTKDTLPAGLSAETPYAVINRTANDFQLSATVGGSAIDITDSGTDTHTVTEVTGFTVTTATNRVNVAGHSYSTDDRIELLTSGTFPAGLSGGPSYFVINPTTNDFQLSLSSGGAAVPITDTGAGVHAIKNNQQVTIITSYGDTVIQELGEIRVNGILILKSGDRFVMKNSSKVNNLSGNVANMLALVENDVVIKNSSLFKGAIMSDGQIKIENNGEVNGALFSSDIKLKNNASLSYETSPSGDGPGETALEEDTSSACNLGLPPGWSE